MPLDSHDTLRRIQDRLNDGRDPLQIIEEFIPQTASEALAWARRRPLWEEFREHSEQVVGIACVISRRAMRAFDLMFSDDGLIEKRRREPGQQSHRASSIFSMTVSGQNIRVEYTPEYLGFADRAHFSFESPVNPPRPHPLSHTGFLSQFAMPAAIAACGGPEAYAARFAEASVRGRLEEFAEAFVGRWPSTKPRRKMPKPAEANEPSVLDQPVLGEHTAKVIEQSKDDHTKPSQGVLF